MLSLWVHQIFVRDSDSDCNEMTKYLKKCFRECSGNAHGISRRKFPFATIWPPSSPSLASVTYSHVIASLLPFARIHNILLGYYRTYWQVIGWCKLIDGLMVLPPTEVKVLYKPYELSPRHPHPDPLEATTWQSEGEWSFSSSIGIGGALRFFRVHFCPTVSLASTPPLPEALRQLLCLLPPLVWQYSCQKKHREVRSDEYDTT